MAARIGRDSFVYALATTSVFPLGLVGIAIQTRFLDASAFGQLAVLFFASGMMTIVLNMFILRGVQMLVWASAEDGMDVATDQPGAPSRRPRVLGTGLVLTVVVSTLAGISVYLLAEDVARLLLGSPSLRTAVIWAGASGALGAVWRFAADILRWERRSRYYGFVYVLRPALAVAISWPLLRAGHGLTGVLAATAIGTVASLMVALIASRRSYVVNLERAASKKIVLRSLPWIAVIFGLSFLHTADVYLVAQVADSEQAGLFRLASRMTVVVSYAVSAFMLAWAPLETSSLFRAAYERHGRKRVRSAFIDYYLLSGAFLVLLLSVTAAPVIDVLAPGFDEAVPLVPVTGAGFLLYGLLIVIARASEFPRRALVYGAAAIVGGAVLVMTSFVLADPLGAYGVALGNVLGALAAIAVIVGVAAPYGVAPPVDLRRTFGIVVLGGLCYAVGVPLAARTGAWQVPLAAASVVAYPLLLALTGIVTAGERRQLRAALRLGVRTGIRPRALIRGIERLPREQQRILLVTLRDHRPMRRVEVVSRLPRHELQADLVHALRTLTGAGTPGPWDTEIGALLLSTASITERDSMARRLLEIGVRPHELHVITSAFESLRAAPARAWKSAAADLGARLPSSPWPMDATAPQILGLVVRDEQPRQFAADRIGIAISALDRELIAALAALAGRSADGLTDRLLAAFLFDGADAPSAHQLWAAGVDPIEVHELELVIAAISSIPDGEWAQIAAGEDMPAPAAVSPVPSP